MNIKYIDELKVLPLLRGRYHLTEADKEKLKEHAVNGSIPFEVYIRVIREILSVKTGEKEIDT